MTEPATGPKSFVVSVISLLTIRKIFSARLERLQSQSARRLTVSWSEKGSRKKANSPGAAPGLFGVILVNFGYQMRTRFYLLLGLLITAIASRASDSLTVFREMPMNARYMTVDELGNVYVVRENNSLVRFTENGDSSAFYRSVQNGDIGAVDAGNPLNLVVYYPDYAKVVLLDRMLAEKNERDLRKLQPAAPPVVCGSADGNLWYYDPFNARLRKIDDQLREVAQSNDLRQEAGTVPQPSFMVERNWKVFLCDTVRGILTFDRYGNYINTLAIYGVRYLQVYGSQLVYRRDDSLFSWDLNRVTSHVIRIPFGEEGIVNAALVRNTLYVLYTDRLVLYRISS